LRALATKWAGILRAWYDHGSQLSMGSLIVRGHPAWNIGHRLVTTDARGEREFYIEGVSHRYDIRTGMYTVALRVTRGWYLDGKTDELLMGGGQLQWWAKPPTGSAPLDPAFTGAVAQEQALTARGAREQGARG